MKTKYEHNDRLNRINELDVECHIARAKQIRSEVVAGMLANAFARLKQRITHSKPVSLKSPFDHSSSNNIGKPCY